MVAGICAGTRLNTAETYAPIVRCWAGFRLSAARPYASSAPPARAGLLAAGRDAHDEWIEFDRYEFDAFDGDGHRRHRGRHVMGMRAEHVENGPAAWYP